MTELTYLHLCVNFNTGKGRVVPWETGLCSNCRKGDPRVFNLCVPSSDYASTKQRIEAEYNKAA
jgi:hypothetical protein